MITWCTTPAFCIRLVVHGVALLMHCAEDGATEDIDDGGWVTDESSMIAQEGPCNIEVRDMSMSQQEFLHRYAYQQPVILRQTDNKAFQGLSRRKEMLDKYGQKIVRLSSANTHSYRKEDVTLEKYITELLLPQTLDRFGNDTMLWFGDNNHTEWAQLFNSYKQPPFQVPGLTGAYSFGAAGAGTGVPFHFHGPGWAEVIYGRKRWFMYPPNQEPAFDGNKTTLHWFVENYPNLPECEMPLECTIHQNEVIYFPDRWWHGTLNIDTSVFISTFLG